MPYPILGTPKPQFFDSSGSPLASGTLSVLDPADDTNKASYPTYDDAVAATNANTNPLTLDSRGEPSSGLWGLDGEDYKLVLKDSGGTTVWTQDDIRVPIILPYLQTAAEAAAGVTPTNYEYEPGNVLRYGTNTTPGTTDMSGALQNAVDVGLDIYFPPGTYKIDLDNVSGNFYTITASGVRVSGAGRGSSILSISSSTTKDLFKLTTGKYFTLDGLTINGNSNGTLDDSFDATTGCRAVVFMSPTSNNSCEGLTIKNCRITDCQYCVLHDFNNAGSGDTRYTSRNVSVVDNIIDNMPGHGVGFNFVSDSVVSGNSFVSIGALCVDVSTAGDNVIVSNNTCDTAAGFGKAQSRTDTFSGNIVSNITFANNRAVNLNGGGSDNVNPISINGDDNSAVNNFLEMTTTTGAGCVIRGRGRFVGNTIKRGISSSGGGIEVIDMLGSATTDPECAEIIGNYIEGFLYAVYVRTTIQTRVIVDANRFNKVQNGVFVDTGVSADYLKVTNNEIFANSTNSSANNMGVRASSTATTIDNVLISGNYIESQSNNILWYAADGGIFTNNRLVVTDTGNYVNLQGAHTNSLVCDNIGTGSSNFWPSQSGTLEVRNNVPTLFTDVRTSTTTALEAVANAVNTDPGKIEGAMVFNTTTNKPVYASGSADADVWVDATGATAHTPV